MQESGERRSTADLFARVDWDVASGEARRSPEWFRMTGYSAGAQDSGSIGFWSERAHPADLVQFYQTLAEFALSGKDELRFNYRLRFADGRWHQMAAYAQVASRGRDGSPSKYCIWEMDLEPFHARDLQVAGLPSSFQPGLSGAWSWEPGSGEVWWSKEVYELTGWPVSEPPPGLEGQSKLYAPESLDRLYEAIGRLTTQGEGFDLVLTLVRTDGRRLPVRATAAITRGRAGSPERVGGTLALLEPGAREGAGGRGTPPQGPVLEVDLRSGELTASPGVARLVAGLGGRGEDPVRALRELLTRGSLDELKEWIAGLDGEPGERRSLKLRTVSGRSIRLWPFGGVEGTGCVFLRLELDDDDAASMPVSDHDDLTGLLSFRAFELLADSRLSASSAGVAQALFKVNINAFRRVNALLGHRRGDQVLRAFATHLGAHIPGALLARRAGDVFIGLVDRPGGEPPEATVARIRAALDSFVPPGLGLIRLRFSLVLVPAEGFASLGELIEAAADILQSCPRGGDVVFGTRDGERLARHREVYRQLIGVAARGELRCVYQPSVSAADGSTRGIETLVRWDSPGLGLISPADFIPMAEETGEIVAIGRWVLGAAIRDFARMRRMGLRVPRVSVNLSPTQFSDSGLLEFALAACREHGVDPRTVVLELTESAFIEDTEITRTALDALTGSGFRLAMDDFGTGYSNLGVLTRLQLSHIKIDRSFVSRMLKDPASRVVVDSITRLARGLSCGTVAEGAESEDEVALLRELGCDEVQGFLYARPMALEDLVAWQAARTPAEARPGRGIAE